LLPKSRTIRGETNVQSYSSPNSWSVDGQSGSWLLQTGVGVEKAFVIWCVELGGSANSNV
jgi:hypothetical protein